MVWCRLWQRGGGWGGVGARTLRWSAACTNAAPSSDPPFPGAFGLLPFMALWQPPREAPKVPADAADLQGWQNLMQARSD